MSVEFANRLLRRAGNTALAGVKLLRQVAFAALTYGLATVHAAEIGHFARGVPSIRDFTMPEPEWYGRDQQLQVFD